MLKKIGILLVVILSITSCDTLSKFVDVPLTQEEAGNGLKEALNLGINTGVSVLSAKDGFYKGAYKILLPQEARKVTDKLKFIPGFSNVEDLIVEKINHGAEDAVNKAKPIFVNAIKQMSFADAMQIVTGDQNAATEYLRQATQDQLYKEFNPVIVKSLDDFGARKYWSDAVNAYNKIPLINKVNPSLDDYVTQQALTAVFNMVAEKEKNIRTNTAERVSELLKKVFSKQDKQ
jgi:hypothetical protein